MRLSFVLPCNNERGDNSRRAQIRPPRSRPNIRETQLVPDTDNDASYAKEYAEFIALVDSMDDEDIKWIAAHTEDYGGAGVSYEHIGFMMAEPDEEMLQICRDLQAPGRTIMHEDAKKLDTPAALVYALLSCPKSPYAQ